MITHIVFSGSNIYGLSFLGVIRYLITHDLIKNVKNVAGTSFGSTIASLIALKVPIEVFEENFTKLCEDEKMRLVSSKNTINLISKLGMDTSSKYIISYKEYLQKYHNCDDMTFIEVSKKFGINLHINALCINTNKEVIFNTDNTPNVSIIDAMSASMAVPFIYYPVLIDGYYYCDNCLVRNVLTNYFENVSSKNILSVISSLPIEFDLIPKNSTLNLFSYISFVFKLCIDLIFKNSSEKYIDKYSLVLNKNVGIQIVVNKKGIEFIVDKEILDNAILYGYHETMLYFEKYYQTIGSSVSSCTTDVV